jgi:ATP:cob(I)alamin adenosyltransferase
MSITTKTGDDGYTSLLNGKRVHKFDLRVELMGAMDELSSYIGLIKYEADDNDMKEELQKLQQNISTIMAQIAYGDYSKYNVHSEDLRDIEASINKYESMYISEGGFILPGKTRLSSLMDVARTIARRVERQAVSVDRFYQIHENCKVYLNRISDYLYSLGRYTDFKDEVTKRVKELLEKESIMISTNKTDIVGINLSIAKEILQKVEEKAEEMGLPVVIAIANEWGCIVAVHFMDGALPASYNIAVDKAYSSATVRLSTEEIGKLAQSGQPLYGIGNTNNNRIITFGGGYPLKINGRIVGGIGVSGGSAQQDSELAAFGAELAENMI